MNEETCDSTVSVHDSTNNVRIIRHCNAHQDEEVNVYCTEDQTMVCHHCFTDGGKHEQHKCQSLEKASVAFSQVNEELENQIKMIHEKMMKFKDQLVVQYEDFKKVCYLYIQFILFIFIYLLFYYIYCFFPHILSFQKLNFIYYLMYLR